MNLAEILVYTDIRQLHQIAGHYGCECNLNSKNELITTLLGSLRLRQTIQAEVERLTPEEVHFLLLLFLDKRSTFTLEDLLAKAGLALGGSAEKSNEQPRKVIASALRRGWLFPVKGAQSGEFQAPIDLREPYVRVWLESRRGDNTESLPEPKAYRDEGTAACDDIYLFLQFLEKAPIPLTTDGGMYKRYQLQLLRLFHIKEEPISKEKWRFGYGLHFDQYPDRFSLLYDFCFYQGWIEELTGQVSITGRGGEWLVGSYSDETYHDLIRFWMRLYKRAIPNLPMLVQLIPLMAGSSWITQCELREILQPFIKPFYYDDSISILHNRILKMMVHLGLLKVAQVDNEWCYAATYACRSWMREFNGFAETTILLK
ncbi:hypothetical protein LOK74_09815 [Brevibacillus humidisoli]|uniref:hypothetical protein n=1 Tax=Brevibacillus humidisoli TaxID=2895522 RepID=UPI001E612853|nr:hypothetical protein [Brevibacillus humidisoli]UFJ42762.1 hypothetical protein LOK74_09815 [Brevibacillus humidisoli]